MAPEAASPRAGRSRREIAIKLRPVKCAYGRGLALVPAAANGAPAADMPNNSFASFHRIPSFIGKDLEVHFPPKGKARGLKRVEGWRFPPPGGVLCDAVEPRPEVAVVADSAIVSGLISVSIWMHHPGATHVAPATLRKRLPV